MSTATCPKSVVGGVCALLVLLLLNYFIAFSEIVSDIYRLSHSNGPNEPLHIFIGSAHTFSTENTDKNRIVISTMALDNSARQMRHGLEMMLMCRSDQAEVVRPTFRAVDTPKSCAWKNYFIECDFQRPANAIALVDETGNAVDVEITPPVAKKYGLAACLARAYYFENWQVLITLLEVYRFHGVQHFSMPIISITKAIHDFLKTYEDEGILRMNNGMLLPKVPGFEAEPNQESYAVNQMLSSHECFFEYRDAAEFLIFADADDLILPDRAHQSLYEKAKELLLQYPRAGSFEFRWLVTDFHTFAPPTLFDIDQTMRSARINEVVEYGKSVVIPRRLAQGIIHGPWPDFARVDGFTNVTLDFSDGQTVHLRGPRYLNDSRQAAMEMRRALIQFKTANAAMKLHDYAPVAQKFRQRIDENSTLKNAYLALPPTQFYYPLMVECYKANAVAAQKGSELCLVTAGCELELPEAPPCVLLDSAFDASHFAGLNTFVYLPKDRHLVHAANCKLPKAKTPQIAVLPTQHHRNYSLLITVLIVINIVVAVFLYYFAGWKSLRC